MKRAQVRPLSAEEKNSGCVVYYQLGQLWLGKERARLLLLLRLLQQPLFAELRTKQQLGYVVQSGEMLHGIGRARVSGVFVLILSKGHPPPQLQAAIDAYMATVATDRTQPAPRLLTDTKLGTPSYSSFEV